jgi:hypothetical protein
MVKNVKSVPCPPPSPGFDPVSEFPHGTCSVCHQTDLLLFDDGSVMPHNAPDGWHVVNLVDIDDAELVDIAEAMGVTALRFPTKCPGGVPRSKEES